MIIFVVGFVLLWFLAGAAASLVWCRYSFQRDMVKRGLGEFDDGGFRWTYALREPDQKLEDGRRGE